MSNGSSSSSSSSGGGCGGCGCILWIIIIWIFFTGMTINGTRYEFGCDCGSGPSLTSGESN